MKLLGFDKRPYLILCEGEGDKRFLEQLIIARSIPNMFQVRFPDRAGDGTGGRSKFGPWLALQWKGAEDFKRNVRAVLVVSDNDADPTKSFQEVLDSLEQSEGFPIPPMEREVAQATGRPPLMIMMLPDGNPGSLETLCLQAIFDRRPDIVAPVDKFVATTPISAWHAGKQAKARLQAVIAAICEDRPECGFVGLWKEHAKFHVPLDHPAFNPIASFLISFGGRIP